MKNQVKKLFPTQMIYNWYRNILRHPKYRWFVVIGTLFYILLPVDFAPDVMPVFGWIDDGMIATLLVTEMSQFVLAELKNQKAKKMTMASTESANEEVIDVIAA